MYIREAARFTPEVTEAPTLIKYIHLRSKVIRKPLMITS